MNEPIRILAVDDEPDLRSLLRIILQGKGFQVEEAASGEAAVTMVSERPPYDLVIMDIMMPGMDGVEACRRIREISSVPMLFLTARSRMEDKQQAYTSGGDDYLVKPFAPSELLLKADSLIRRYRVYKGKRPAPESDALRLDEDRKTALKDGEPILLTDKEYEILRFFFQNRGQVIDVRTLYENVWGEKYLSSSNNTVMVHVLNLRKKLESDPANPKLIRTVWGQGYQFGEENAFPFPDSKAGRYAAGLRRGGSEPVFSVRLSGPAGGRPVLAVPCPGGKPHQR